MITVKLILRHIYRFLPVQLLLLHFRKSQHLLLFWVILFATITGGFARNFGAYALFLAPEYLGEVNFIGMVFLGAATSAYIMAWQITTFIIHSRRVPYIGATRYSFLKFCINNSLIPVLFYVLYTVLAFQYLKDEYSFSIGQIITLLLGYYIGNISSYFASLIYFFRMDKDWLKELLSKVTNPGLLKDLVPYDQLDEDGGQYILAHTYISGYLRIERLSKLSMYPTRMLNQVLKHQHKNALYAGFVSYVLLIVLGLFAHNPFFVIPAGASFLILFAVLIGVVGAMKHFLQSWEFLGWLIILSSLTILIKWHWFDLRSHAIGLDYSQSNTTTYNYQVLKATHTFEKQAKDKIEVLKSLTAWKQQVSNGRTKVPMVIVNVSGGGSRAAYYAFRVLTMADSITNKGLYKYTTFITGASGGMLGATYWKQLHHTPLSNEGNEVYQSQIGSNLLNPVIFSLATTDLLSPFNKVRIRNRTYQRDRGYAFEEALIRQTKGVLDKKLNDWKELEAAGQAPLTVFYGTILNDSRKLMLSSRPVSFLSSPEGNWSQKDLRIIDAVDAHTLFQKQLVGEMRLTSAIRMTGSFPIVLPTMKFPTQPVMNVIDGGLRDNFGIQMTSRYLLNLQEWIKDNISEVIIIQIRDSRSHDVYQPLPQEDLSSMLLQPAVVMTQQWMPFQSYEHEYLKDYIPYLFKDKITFLNFEYIPEDIEKAAALNYYLTQKEKDDLLQSANHPNNTYNYQYLFYNLK